MGIEIYKKYNLSYLKITNKSLVEGDDEFPILPSKDYFIPDYLCLYKNKKDYFKTPKTAICFYEYDNEFDGINGIFNAIYYDNKKLLNKYKERFKNIKMIVEPDYSRIRDIETIENKYRQFKSRLVGLWFLTELKIPVIPNLSYSSEESFSYMLDGIKNSNMLAISLKGIMNKKEEINLLQKAIKYVCDNSNIKKFIIYSTINNLIKINKIFQYAISKEVQLIIPNNILLERNSFLNKSD